MVVQEPRYFKASPGWDSVERRERSRSRSWGL
jgi:hypothetical protein